MSTAQLSFLGGNEPHDEADCLAAKLRLGNVHIVEGWEELLLPDVERQQELGKDVVFRADAAFAKPEIYGTMEERGVKYAIRFPANGQFGARHQGAADVSGGRPSHKPIV